MSEALITTEELQGLFGEYLPMEAVALIFPETFDPPRLIYPLHVVREKLGELARGRGGIHRVEELWREVGLPEEFLGNGGSNHKLYHLYDRIRAEAMADAEMATFRSFG